MFDVRAVGPRTHSQCPFTKFTDRPLLTKVVGKSLFFFLPDLIPIVPRLSVAQLADFGFAQHLDDRVGKKGMRGSPLYMAPEILLQNRYDARYVEGDAERKMTSREITDSNKRLIVTKDRRYKSPLLTKDWYTDNSPTDNSP